MSQTRTRHDFYGPIHKGLRMGSARLLTALGATDWRDDETWRPLIAALKTHLVLAKEHLEHEDAEIIPPLREAAPDLAGVLDHDHADHYATFAALDAAIAHVESTPPSTRAVAGHALYLRFTGYFGEDLAHMAREENEALPAFHRLFSDADMMAMEGRIIASIEPDKLTDYYMLMIPAMTPQERAHFLLYVKMVAPPAAFAHLHNVARAALSPDALSLLDEDLAAAA